MALITSVVAIGRRPGGIRQPEPPTPSPARVPVLHNPVKRTARTGNSSRGSAVKLPLKNWQGAVRFSHQKSALFWLAGDTGRESPLLNPVWFSRTAFMTGFLPKWRRE